MFTHTLTALRAAEHQQHMQSEAALARRVRRRHPEQPSPAVLGREQQARRRPGMAALGATARQAAKLACWL